LSKWRVTTIDGTTEERDGTNEDVVLWWASADVVDIDPVDGQRADDTPPGGSGEGAVGTPTTTTADAMVRLTPATETPGTNPPGQPSTVESTENTQFPPAQVGSQEPNPALAIPVGEAQHPKEVSTPPELKTPWLKDYKKRPHPPEDAA
jgi:hypothetical protein